MCILAISLGSSEEFPFILISIRDEYTIRRDSTDPIIEEDILYSKDIKSNGSWLLFNTKLKKLGVILNIGGRGKTKGKRKSRGKLLYDFVSTSDDNNESVSTHLNWMERKEYPGFNLFWFDFDKNEGCVTSNCDPNDFKKETPTIHKLKDNCINVVGNDLYGDEFVKSPYLQEEMEKIIKSHQFCGVSDNSENDRFLSAQSLAKKLGNQLTGFPASNPFNIFTKFFCFGKKRRIQPGFNTFLSLLMLSCFIFILYSLLFQTLSYFLFFLLFTISFVLGFTHHLLMQFLFVHVPFKYFGLEWKTVSQTVILKSKEGKYYYFFRRTKTKEQLEKWYDHQFH